MINSEGEKKRLKPAKNKKISLTGLYTTLGLSLAMLFAAGYFAYSRASNELGNALEQAAADTTMQTTTTPRETDSTRAVGVVTSVPRETTSRSEAPRETTTVTAAVTTEAPRATETVPVAQTVVCVFPVQGEVILGFSGDELIKSATTGIWSTHNGADIAAEKGTPVNAMCKGRVIEIYNDALWSYSVTLDHGNGLISKYCGLSADIPVSLGTEIEVGAVIGSIGDGADTESALPSHLHFEVKQFGEYIDPIMYIEGFKR